MTIHLDRHHIVLVYKNKVNGICYCAFCSIKNIINEKLGMYHDIHGNCPIDRNYCTCYRHYDRFKSFNNNDDIILTTIYKCNMKGTICYRDCNLCAVNKLITIIHEQSL